jgi:hypothetical protein
VAAPRTGWNARHRNDRYVPQTLAAALSLCAASRNSPARGETGGHYLMRAPTGRGVPYCFVGVIRGANSAVLEAPSRFNRAPYDAWAARVKVAAGPDGALPDFGSWDGVCRGYSDHAVGKGVHSLRILDQA